MHKRDESRKRERDPPHVKDLLRDQEVRQIKNENHYKEVMC